MATSAAPARWVERPLEPVVTSGRGMHMLGFVPRGGLHLMTATAATSSTSTSPDLAKGSSCKAAGRREAAGKDGSDEIVNGHVTVRGPGKWKSGRPVYTHGNYTDYYGYRLAGSGHSLEDPRLTAVTQHLGENVFRGKDVLDVGCNSGRVPLAVSRLFGARRVVGQDIDAGLIEAAQQFQESCRELPGCCEVEFRAEDVLESPLRRPPDMLPEKFDVLLCLSVTKWVHFAHGDRGIRNLFRRCFKRLRRGGLLVLEPQDWASYKKKRHLTREIRETVAGIEMQPKDFAQHLIGLGFEHIGTAEPCGEVTKGFRRSILLLKKPMVVLDGTDEVQEDAAEMPTSRKRKVEHTTAGAQQKKKKNGSKRQEHQENIEEESSSAGNSATQQEHRKSATKLAGG
mmetsp:Transcript_155652/g.290519  ORF Transcript_155652/g.290519 Transcript_155652/m.290519 type:complete len:398 (+) Transcript_155652:102-1295(+)